MSFEFYTGADTLAKVFWIFALAGTIFFVLRTILIFIGADVEGDMEGIDADMDTHSDAAFDFISINTLTAFIMMFGWGGLTAYVQYKLSPTISILIGTVCGVATMFITAWIFASAKKLTSKGTVFKIEDTVGLNASVYQRIPASGTGKVNITLPGGILRELDAVSEDKVEIDSFKTVKVVNKIDNRTVSVRQL